MRVPDEAGGLGGGHGSADDLRSRPAAARAGWRGWAGDVAFVVRHGWRATAAVLLVTMVLPLVPLCGLIADGAALGKARAGWGKSFGPILSAILAAPVLLALGIGCGLVVARGWTGAVWAAASVGSGRPAGLRDALAHSRRRSRLLWGIYLAGVVVLVAAAFHSGLTAPGASTVPNVLALAGPTGLMAPVLCFAPAAAWRRPTPGAGDPPAADGVPAATPGWACLVPMAFVLVVVVGCEAAAALALSWLMTPASPEAASASISAPAAAIIASLVALPGSVLLAAASSVSYVRLRASRRG